MKYTFTEVALAYKILKIMINQGSYRQKQRAGRISMYEGWNFNSGNYLFTTDTK